MFNVSLINNKIGRIVWAPVTKFYFINFRTQSHQILFCISYLIYVLFSEIVSPHSKSVKTQQIPKPLAHGPEALPLLSVHSENYFLLSYSVSHVITYPSKELCSKMALGDAGVSLPWWCHTLVLPAPGYWGLFLNIIIFS